MPVSWFLIPLSRAPNNEIAASIRLGYILKKQEAGHEQTVSETGPIRLLKNHNHTQLHIL